MLLDVFVTDIVPDPPHWLLLLESLLIGRVWMLVLK